jgi:hypothetical protein
MTSHFGDYTPSVPAQAQPTLHPEQRQPPVQGMTATEAALGAAGAPMDASKQANWYGTGSGTHDPNYHISGMNNGAYCGEPPASQSSGSSAPTSVA